MQTYGGSLNGSLYLGESISLFTGRDDTLGLECTVSR